MGRGRLRRGCSLEVIFEEDPDFCSHLDSLDGGVAIRFGIKEPDETISLDSLLEVEEYQVHFQDPADAEQVFRSLDGIIDIRNMDSCMVEWDEFSMDSNSSKVSQEAENASGDRDSFHENTEVEGQVRQTVEKAPSGRRSRVSRRQIIQATWLGYSSSSDESVTNNEPDDNDNSSSSTKTHRRRSPNSILGKTKDAEFWDEQRDVEPTTSSSLLTNCATNSPPSPPKSVLSSAEEFHVDGKTEPVGLKPPIQLQLRSSPNNTDGAQSSSHYAMFGRQDGIDIMEKDTLDSYISTMTDDTDTNAYTFADPFDDTHSVASTNYESSGSTSSTESNGSVCTVNSFSMQNGRSKSNGNEGKNGSRFGNAGIKYRSNLKVELVSQLNESQEGNCSAKASTSVGGSMNPSNLYLDNSHVNLQSSAMADQSSPSTSVPSKYPHHLPLQRQQQPLLSHQQTLSDHERQSLGGDVKRVRALFELRNHSRTSLNGNESHGSSGNGSTCPSSPESPSRSISSRNGGDTSPCGSSSGRVGLYSKNGRRSRASPQNQQHSQVPSVPSTSKGLCSSYNNLSLTQMNTAVTGSSPNVSGGSTGGGNHPSSYDYVDLLVNDNVVIEDAPDIYQTNRNRRQGNLEKDTKSSSPARTASRPVTLMNLSPREVTTGSCLRRSRSMGTGIASLGSPSVYGMESEMLKQSSSKTNILAEELPAPDTVKNVRNVFENMLKMRGCNNGSESSVDTMPTGFSGSFSIVKKSLSYIKSNPTSKIYRSESMRDDFPSLGRRFGKPVLMSETNSPVHSPSIPSFVASSLSSSSVVVEGLASDAVSTPICSAEISVVDGVTTIPLSTCGSSSVITKNQVERRVSEPAKFSPKINTGFSPTTGVPGMLRASVHTPLTEEDSSFSSNVTTEDYRSRKYVHPDVLQKIRSAGTTTTYFGGKIVGKTIKNRKLPVSRRHTFDFQDYVGFSGDGATSTNYDSYTFANYYKEDEASDKCTGSATSESNARGGSRPALEIPLKSSSSTNIYASRNTTISGALDSIFGGVGGLLTFASKPIDTTPRIISVLTKSPPGSQTGSPVKSCSPVNSVIEEGRNSPEGCEASNEKAIEQDGNNNNLPGKVDSSSHSPCTGATEDFSKKFSQITEGAWF